MHVRYISAFEYDVIRHGRKSLRMRAKESDAEMMMLVP
jgi:hypothetical protein